jgi:hypothetical protein
MRPLRTDPSLLGPSSQMTRPDSSRLNNDFDDGRERRAPRRRAATANSFRADVFRPRDRAARIGADFAVAPSEHTRILPATQKPGFRLLGFAALALVLIECAFWIAHADRPARPPICVAWDDTARRTLAPMMHANAVITSPRLNDALAQLRRARRNCHAGRLDQARRDYEALKNLSGLAQSSLPQD